MFVHSFSLIHGTAPLLPSLLRFLHRMATSGESSDEEKDEEKHLEAKVRQLRTSKKELFERTRPVNERLERIAQSERECIDELHRIREKKHAKEKYHQTIQRLIESQSELERIKRENVKLSDAIKKLKRSLDEATKYSKVQRQKIADLELSKTYAERPPLTNIRANARSATVENSCTFIELQKQLRQTTQLLNKTKEELRETRQRLSDVQERLTVAEQVTTATQQRALQESGNDSEQLQVLELTPQHQPTTQTGADILTCLSSTCHTHQDRMFMLNYKK